MVKVDGVCLEDVDAIRCSGIDVLAEFAGVERGVVIVADGKGNSIYGRWHEDAAPAHKVHKMPKAICALRPKGKPRPLVRPRGVRPPCLPRKLEASV